jgi:hypothetical protein
MEISSHGVRPIKCWQVKEVTTVGTLCDADRLTLWGVLQLRQPLTDNMFQIPSKISRPRSGICIEKITNFPRLIGESLGETCIS